MTAFTEFGTTTPLDELRLLTASDLAKLWKMDASTVYRIMQSGEIPIVKMGRCIRVTPEDARAYISACRRGAQ